MANSYNELFGLGTHSEDASLEFLLKLQETTGTSAVDSSSNGRNGTITGMGANPTVGTGPTNWLSSAFDFDGTDDYVDLGSLGLSGSDHSLCLFMKLDADPPATFNKGGFGNYGENGTRAGTDANLFPWTDGNVYSSTFRGDSSTTSARTGGISVTPALTSWRQVCIKTVPGASGWVLRIDGSTVSTQLGVSGVYMGGVHTIGYNTDGTNNLYLDGLIAGVTAFTRKITDAEEAQYFAGPEPLSTSVPTVSVGPTSWTGTIGTWNSQSNGTVSVAWELRKISDDSVVESGTSSPGGSVGGTGTYPDTYYLWTRGSNDGGYDSGEDISSAVSTIYTESVTSTLSLTDSAIGAGPILDSASSTITFSQDATYVLDSPLNQALSSVLTFTDSVVAVLLFSDRQIVSSELAFVDDVFVHGSPDSEHSLALTSEATFELLSAGSPNHFLGLAQEAVAVFGVPWLPIEIEHSLGLTDSLSSVFPVSVVDTLVFTQSAVGSYGLSHSLGLTDSAVGGIGHSVASLIEFQQVVSTAGSQWSRAVISTVTFTSNANAFTPENGCTRRYGTPKGPTSQGRLTLRSQDGAHEVVLRNPETDNSRRASFSRVLRETRGGNLTVYKDPNWPTIQKLLFTIVANKRASLTELQEFFYATLGLEIILVDWLGDEWLGVVINPDEPATEDREGYWTISFELEGRKKPSKSGNQSLGLTHSATCVLVKNLSHNLSLSDQATSTLV